MAKLGEILVALQFLNNEQLHEGLAAQVLYGGRLGTNLVELGYLTLDQLARGLARLHRVPAALGGHFDRCDAELQLRVPTSVAGKWRAVPIGRLAHDAARIAVAVRDPLSEHARGEIAYHLDVEPDHVVLAVAPELRIHYHLEVAYQIPRSNRFLRVHGRVPTELPVPPASDDHSDIEGWRFQEGVGLVRVDTAEAADAEITVPVSVLVPAPAETTTEVVSEESIDRASDAAVEVPLDAAAASTAAASAADADESDDDSTDDAPRARPPDSAPPDLEVGMTSDPALRLDYQQAPLVPSLNGGAVDPVPERRRFVPSLGDQASPSPLARIAVRQVASETALRAVPEVAPVRGTSPDELARAVRRAPSRDRVGDLVVSSLAELPGSPLDAVAILVVRPPLAIGWKGFCSEGSPAIESLAVPLDQPSVLAEPYRRGIGSAVVIDPTLVSVIDERMWSLLGSRPPANVLVAPILVGERVICLLYAHSRGAMGAAEAMVTSLAEAAGTAFSRLLRATQR